MGWTLNNDLSMSHSGTTKDAWILTTAIPPRPEIRAWCNDCDKEPFILLRPGGDGKDAIMAGIRTGNVVLIERENGVEGSTIDSASHGLTSGQPFLLRARIDGDTVSVWCSHESGSEATATGTTTKFRSHGLRAGLYSEKNGTVVSWVEVGAVVDRISTVENVGLAVVGGGVYRSMHPGQWELVDSNVTRTSGRVGTAVLLGKVYIVDGTHGYIYDPITNTIVDWEPTSGTLLGNSGDPNVTTADLIVEHLGGLVMAASDGVTIKGTAINEPLVLNTGERLFGSAYEIGVGRNLTVGDLIVSIAQGPSNTLLVATTGSINYMVGDPYRGTAEMITRAETVGASGPDSCRRITDSRGRDLMIVHAPEGLQVVPVLSGPIDLSAGVLQAYLTFPRAKRKDRTVVVVRDPARSWLHVFISESTAAGSVHLIYDEIQGGYKPGSPAYYPITLPVRITAAAIVRGVVLLGTDDGRIVRFDDLASTDLGQSIASRVSLRLLDVPQLDNDTIVERPAFLLGDSSSAPTLTFYGGGSAQTAYSVSRRRRLSSTTVPVRHWPIGISARAPFIVAVLETSTGRLVFERMEATVSPAALTRIDDTLIEPAAPTPTMFLVQAPPATPSLPEDPPVYPGSIDDGSHTEFPITPEGGGE